MTDSTIRKLFTAALGLSCLLTLLAADADARHKRKKADRLPVKKIVRETKPIVPILVQTVSFKPGPVRDDPKPLPQPNPNLRPFRQPDNWLHSAPGKRFSLLLIGCAVAVTVWGAFKPEGRSA